jgi:hypothetical protein
MSNHEDVQDDTTTQYSTGWRPEPFVYSIMFEYVKVGLVVCFVSSGFGFISPVGDEESVDAIGVIIDHS